MDRLRVLLQRKPIIFLFGNFCYVVLAYLLRWNIHPTMNAVWFFVGSILGMYFLEAAEEFFRLDPSPFRSIVFVGLFAIVSFFVVSSSGSFLAIGLVLSIFLTLLLWQLGEWVTAKHLNRWYEMLADPVPIRVQFWILLALGVLFVLETALFVRGA